MSGKVEKELFNSFYSVEFFSSMFFVFNMIINHLFHVHTTFHIFSND